MERDNPIVIIGGYGIVGSEIVRLLRMFHPEMPIAIAGRSPEKAAALQNELGNLQFISIDVLDLNSLQNLPMRPSALVCTVNDTNDNVLRKALSDGIPLVDITRWNAPFIKTIEHVKLHKLKAPIIFASSWMAGVSAILARYTMNGLADAESVNIDILYALKDKSGPNSIEFMDQFHKAFAVIEGHQLKWIKPLRDSQITDFPENRRFRTYRFGTPEQYTLPLTTGIHSAVTRISFDSSLATWLLASLVRSGLWSLISSNRFNGLRRVILHSQGNGDSALLKVETRGRSCKRIVTVIDRKGQRHLTAVGTLIQIERILGLDNFPPPTGITFPEQTPDIENTIKRLTAYGVQIENWPSGGKDGNKG